MKTDLSCPFFGRRENILYVSQDYSSANNQQLYQHNVESILIMFCIFISQVNDNGVLSFRGRFYDSFPDPFPLSLSYYHVLIAPFWNDVDLYRGGNVFYRFTDDDYILNDVGMTIRDAFNNDFSPALLFIATWDRVPARRFPYTME